MILVGFFWSMALRARHGLRRRPRASHSIQKRCGTSICIKNEVNRPNSRRGPSLLRPDTAIGTTKSRKSSADRPCTLGRRSSRRRETHSVLALTSLLITRFTSFLMQILSPRCFRVDREGRGGPWRPWRASRGRVQKNPPENH